MLRTWIHIVACLFRFKPLVCYYLASAQWWQTLSCLTWNTGGKICHMVQQCSIYRYSFKRWNCNTEIGMCVYIIIYSPRYSLFTITRSSYCRSVLLSTSENAKPVINLISRLCMLFWKWEVAVKYIRVVSRPKFIEDNHANLLYHYV